MADKMTRRQVIQMAYVAPLVLTLPVTPSFAMTGSGAPHSRRRPHINRPRITGRRNVTKIVTQSHPGSRVDRE